MITKVIPSLRVAMLLLIVSCTIPSEKQNKDIELQPITVENDYVMSVPVFMTKSNLLNEDASLQYQNVFKEAYVIVIDESKTEFLDALHEADLYDSTVSMLENYANTQIQLTSSRLNVITTEQLKKFKINGLRAAQTQVDAEVEGVPAPLSYFITFNEGDDKFYMVMAWTLQKNKSMHEATFAKMVKTFKQITSPGGTRQ